MPYKFETDKKKLPRKLDRRVRLTAKDKERILMLIKNTTLSNAKIWTMYWVHRKTIYLLRNPAQAANEKKAYKQRRLDGRYYNKEKHNDAMQSLRQHKKANEQNLI